MKKILFIEDAPDLVEIYRASLSSVGYDVINTDDPTEGFEKALSEKPGLILLDIILPPRTGEVADLNKRYGYEILKRLKGHPETKVIPVIILSNLNSPEDQKHAKDLGADHYIVKADVLPQDVIKIVKSYFYKKK